MATVVDYTDALTDFIAASPTSYHAAKMMARQLRDCGFERQLETEPWDARPGGHYLVRDGAVVAWWVPEGADASSGFRIVGTHTDSPGFKLKPLPDILRHGWQSLGVEIYGGPLLNSWLDRDLGIAGRVIDTEGTHHLVRTGAICRIPQLAIHLDRGVTTEGLLLDKQQHTAPIVGLAGEDIRVLDVIATQAGLEDASAISAHELYLYDTQSPQRIGAKGDLYAAGRLDNLSSTFAALYAMRHLDQVDHHDVIVMAAFDHEEVGSATRSGAGGPLLNDVLQRTAIALGAKRERVYTMLARSFLLSCDAGHAVHPNYPGHHDPDNRPLLNAGVLLKVNAQQRYATDAVGTAVFHRSVSAAGTQSQTFVSNNAMPCGSTIGPISATRLGITTVDVGVPLLSMHSARELAGTADLYDLARIIGAFFRLETLGLRP
ncbi:MAG: M18 family aminopeptidase [Bowdeniella nasicola]|nr:M18 family aminopeptidase [Bowdeniella nasicola]